MALTKMVIISGILFIVPSFTTRLIWYVPLISGVNITSRWVAFAIFVVLAAGFSVTAH
jgi:hypothetical protein